MNIDTPQELLKQLVKIFPDYEFEWDAYGYGPTDFSYHSLLMDFTTYYGSKNSDFDERQVRACADLVNTAVDAGGNLENAFATCFLEHLGQVGAKKTLKKHLSNAAKDRLRA